MICTIGKEEVAAARETLEKYRAAKQKLDRRITENEKWFRMRRESGDGEVSRSAWLFNSIINKHADFMDNIPSVSVLPREKSDEKTAEALTKIIPAVLENANWEETYSDASMYKLKAGAAVYSVLWNPSLSGGRGDIDIKQVDILNLFWEPGVRDIQKSRALFCVELVDNDILLEEYPYLEKLSGNAGARYGYSYDPETDLTGKSEVVDMYYRKKCGGRTVLHYMKFTGDELIYASENDEGCAENGWYEHGLYPFVFDPLFREEGTPAGFGFIDVMKGAQEEIDLLGTEIMRNARLSARKRYFTRVEGAVSEEEFADFGRDFVHVRGSSLGEDSIREIDVSPVSPVCVTVLNNKIEELKETSGNRDFSQGGTAGGVTSGTAITALQEAGSKVSRDMINASFRAFSRVCSLVIGLIRQFYDTKRSLRIIAPDGGYEYVSFDNSALKRKATERLFGIDFASEEPVFDIFVETHRRDAAVREQRNSRALEFFNMGFFKPERRAEALACLEITDFENKEKIRAALEGCGS